MLKNGKMVCTSRYSISMYKFSEKRNICVATIKRPKKYLINSYFGASKFLFFIIRYKKWNLCMNIECMVVHMIFFLNIMKYVLKHWVYMQWEPNWICVPSWTLFSPRLEIPRSQSPSLCSSRLRSHQRVSTVKKNVSARITISSSRWSDVLPEKVTTFLPCRDTPKNKESEGWCVGNQRRRQGHCNNTSETKSWTQMQTATLGFQSEKQVGSPLWESEFVSCS
jgi:hypothetical protein